MEQESEQSQTIVKTVARKAKKKSNHDAKSTSVIQMIQPAPDDNHVSMPPLQSGDTAEDLELDLQSSNQSLNQVELGLQSSNELLNQAESGTPVVEMSNIIVSDINAHGTQDVSKTHNISIKMENTKKLKIKQQNDKNQIPQATISTSNHDTAQVQGSSEHRVGLSLSNCFSLHNKLLKIHYGTDNPFQLQHLMQQEVKEIELIHNKRNDPTTCNNISFDESNRYWQSRYYALMCMQLQQSIFNNEVNQVFVDQDRNADKHLIGSLILNSVIKEIQWFGKKFAAKFIKKYNLELKHLDPKEYQFDPSKVIDDVIPILKKKIRIKLKGGLKQTKKPVHKAWLDYCLVLWPRTIEPLYCDIFKKILLKNKESLNRDWNLALTTSGSAWITKFKKIMQVSNNNKQGTLNKLLWRLMCQSAKAMYRLIAMITLYVPMAKQLTDECVIWKSDAVWATLKVAISVWPTVLRHFWKPTKYSNKNMAYDANNLGLSSFYLALFALFIIDTPSKWEDENECANTYMPFNAYGFKGTWDQLTDCYDLINHELLSHQYNFDKQLHNHLTCKFTPLVFVYVAALYENHLPILKKIYNKGIFTDDISFTCDLSKMDDGDKEPLQCIWDNYVFPSDLLTEDEENSIIITLEQIYNVNFNLYDNPKTDKLTKYTEIGQRRESRKFSVFFLFCLTL